MKKIEIFDPAMCCPTGLCGTSINPELMRIAVVIETLKKQGIIVTRHNLRDEPQVYTDYISGWRSRRRERLPNHQANE